MGYHGAGDRRARSVGVASALVRRQKRTAMSSVTATFTAGLINVAFFAEIAREFAESRSHARRRPATCKSCGGCDMRLAQRIGAELATTKVVPYASTAWDIR